MLLSGRFSNLMERIQPGAAAVWPSQQLDGEYETWCYHAAHFSNLMKSMKSDAAHATYFSNLMKSMKSDAAHATYFSNLMKSMKSGAAHATYFSNLMEMMKLGAALRPI